MAHRLVAREAQLAAQTVADSVLEPEEPAPATALQLSRVGTLASGPPNLFH
jgi:hypothetical protein